MGSTPREHTLQIPMPTRGSEIGECFGRTILSYLREDEQVPASFFILGDVLHRVIEDSINHDYDLDQAMDAMNLIMDFELSKVMGQAVIEGAGRGMETIFEDARRMIHNWFRFVHPDSEKRHPVYDDYEWPPATEVEWKRDAGTRYGVWGSIDALFEAKVEEARNYQTGNGLLIVDWKSGVKRPDGPFQLDYYRFGAGLRDAQAHYHMLDRVRSTSIVVEAPPYPGDEAIRAAISATERAKEATVRGVMPKFNPDWYCGYCPVQHLCPVDGDPRNRSRNEKDLRKLLKKAEPLMTLPE